MTDRSASRKRKRDALTPPRCEIPGCDWLYNYQRHRIIPGRDGGKYKLGNVIGLCPNHHALADDGVLPAEYLLEIVRKRIEKSGDQSTTDGTASPEIVGSGTPEEYVSGDGVGPADAGNGIDAGVTDS